MTDQEVGAEMRRQFIKAANVASPALRLEAKLNAIFMGVSQLLRDPAEQQ